MVNYRFILYLTRNILHEMKELPQNLNSIELTKIIRSLMQFIVIDGRKFIDEKKKKEYIKSYIYTFSKSINGMNDFVNMKMIHDQIEKDIMSGGFDNTIK